MLLDLMQRKMEERNFEGAAALARAAAPYVHPRATASKRNNPDLSQLTDAELDAYRRGRGMEAEAKNPA